jgi:hypothetical protein
MTSPAAAADAVTIEFERQLDVLTDAGYPEAPDVSPTEFRHRLAPFRTRLEGVAVTDAVALGRLPFIIVVTRGPGWEQAMARIEVNGKHGLSVLDAAELARFRPIEGVEIPEGFAYLLLDIDAGEELLNVTPERALDAFAEDDRSPLTIEEGIAVLTQHPSILKQKNAFSLAGSRGGDRRVAALWMSKGHPKLGWCWAGNPHTWLGTASCRSRAGE